VIGDDRNGDLMAVRKDGAQIGHISGGQIEVLAERDVEVTEIASLT
jgi:xanthine/CO dehydrogenase XdhC/CoxF family maturation factor